MQFRMDLNNLTLTLDMSIYIPHLFLLLSFLILLVWATLLNDYYLINKQTFFLTFQILVFTFLLLINNDSICNFTLNNGLNIIYSNVNGTSYNFDEFFYNNNIIIYFQLFILIISFYILLQSYFYVRKHTNNYSIQSFEFPLLILFYILSAFLFINAYSFISLYLAFELCSLTAYILISFRQNETSLQASLKYFVMSCLSTLFFLLGYSIWYAFTGVSSYTDGQLLIYIYKLMITMV